MRDTAIMFTRRRLMHLPALALPALAAGRALAKPVAEAPANPLDQVDPLIGTGGHGHTYPGASTPFGMVQLSPDTNNAGWDASSGYHHDDPTIMGFSHTHLPGTGVGDLLDLLVVPFSGPASLDPGAPQRPKAGYHSRFDRIQQGLSAGDSDTSALGYRARFDHADEQARPGLYRVSLKDRGVQVELTATARAGLHRYHFPKAQPAALLFDFAHGSRNDDFTPTRVSEAFLEWRAPDLLVGGRRVHQWADGRLIFFALKLSHAPVDVRLYANDQPLGAGARRAEGALLKSVADLGPATDEPVLVKVGLSAVDVDGALRNLDAEIPAWDFEGVRAAATQAWASELSRVKVEGGTERQRRIFHTALYHAFLAPTLFTDVDGRYRGMDSAVRQLPPHEARYSTYSLWDTYRALSPLFTLIQPERAAGIARDLARMAQESPSGPAIWPLQGVETFCMNGWHSAAILAEAMAKGLGGPEVAAAWPIYRKRAFDDRQGGLPQYRALGFIPADQVSESVSKTLEYAYDDWAMASLAEACGAPADAAALRKRALNYRNLFDPAIGFMRPRLASGAWVEPYQPQGVNHINDWNDFTECDGWQATFIPQHGLAGYMALFGGPKAFEAKLDALFAAPTEITGNAPPDIAGMVGQYSQGNEPCHHVAYLYAYAGAAHKTQARVRMLLETQYDDQPDGLAGNEDCGQMSAWYVMSALGLYAVDPVSGLYVLGSPLFDRAELAVGGQRTLEILAHGNGPSRLYVQAARWNGKPLPGAWIAHADLAKGGRLEFWMDERPNPAFGAGGVPERAG